MGLWVVLTGMRKEMENGIRLFPPRTSTLRPLEGVHWPNDSILKTESQISESFRLGRLDFEGILSSTTTKHMQT